MRKLCTLVADLKTESADLLLMKPSSSSGQGTALMWGVDRRPPDGEKLIPYGETDSSNSVNFWT